MKVFSISLVLLLTPLFFSSCTKEKEATSPSSPVSNALPKGVGPISELKLVALDSALAKQGQATFTAKCSACHKIDERYVGPALKGVTKRRAPEWIMNMALNPAEMTEKDETAKGLLGEYMTQMSFQNVSQAEVRSILEYFRQNDQ